MLASLLNNLYLSVLRVTLPTENFTISLPSIVKITATGVSFALVLSSLLGLAYPHLLQRFHSPPAPGESCFSWPLSSLSIRYSSHIGNHYSSWQRMTFQTRLGSRFQHSGIPCERCKRTLPWLLWCFRVHTMTPMAPHEFQLQRD